MRIRSSSRAISRRLLLNAMQVGGGEAAAPDDDKRSVPKTSPPARTASAVTLSAPPAVSSRPPGEPRFIVRTKGNLAPVDSIRETIRAASACGGHVRSVQPFCCRTAVVCGAAPAVGGAIEAVEPDLRIKIQGSQIMPWGLERIRAPAARSRTAVRPVNCDVFVLDTGVARGHRDLNVVEARSFVAEEPSPWDLHGHGTAVAGVIGALDNRTDVVGVAPGVRIHSLKVLNATGDGYLSDIVAAVEHMIRWKRAMGSRVRNAVVANLSLGGYVGSSEYTALDVALREAARAGITVVVAAGNEGADATLYTPAHAREVLAVGSCDENHMLSPWSNWGAPVRVQAPGSDILTTYLDNRLARISGTSFAAPHAAGAAALYLARRRTRTPARAIYDICRIAGGRYIPRVNVAGRPNTTTRRLDCVGL